MMNRLAVLSKLVSSLFHRRPQIPRLRIDIHVLGGREHLSEAPIRRIDIGQELKVISSATDKFLFCGGKVIFLCEVIPDRFRDEMEDKAWYVLLVDPKQGQPALERMKAHQKK